MYVNYWIGLWQLQAVSCKAVYDLFTKLIDPATNTGHVVAAPIQKYVRGALVAQSVLHSHVGMLAASVVTAAFFSTAKEKKHCPSLTPVLVGTVFSNMMMRSSCCPPELSSDLPKDLCGRVIEKCSGTLLGSFRSKEHSPQG